MPRRKVATVFGGSGFIGRHVVKRLAASGWVVRVGVRDPEAALFLKPMGAVGQVVPLYAPISDRAAVQRVVAGAERVVNCVGLLAERRKGEFQRVHVEGAGIVAEAAAAAGVARLVHLSAIGADPAGPSRYAASKAAGEAAVRGAFPAAAILRPSVVFGPEDRFFNLIGALVQALWLVPVLAPAMRLQPVFVGDVADAVMAVAEAAGRAAGAAPFFELAGPQVWTMRELVEWVVRETNRRRRLVNVGLPGARALAAVLERLPGRVLTRDLLLLLTRDNVATPGVPGLRELGLHPRPVELVVPGYLARFRRDGGSRLAYAG